LIVGFNAEYYYVKYNLVDSTLVASRLWSRDFYNVPVTIESINSLRFAVSVLYKLNMLKCRFSCMLDS